jgi:hypothetical protein
VVVLGVKNEVNIIAANNAGILALTFLATKTQKHKIARNIFLCILVFWSFCGYSCFLLQNIGDMQAGVFYPVKEEATNSLSLFF